MLILNNEIEAQNALLVMQLPQVALTAFELANQTLTNLALNSVSKEKLAHEWAYRSALATKEFGQVEIEVWSSYLQGESWTTPDLVRFQLIANLLLNLPESQRRSVLVQCIRYADDDEKIILLKGLAILSPKGDLVSHVVNLGRTNNSNVFASMAIHNCWPAEHFTDAEFEQMVLKALFLSLNIDFIYGIKQRHTSRLSQLAFDYLNERAAAKRDWPQSIYSVIRKKDLTTQQVSQLNTFPEQVNCLIYENNNN